MIFNKHKTEQIQQLLGSLLDSQDADVVVVRGQDCRLLFLNTSAQNRLPENQTRRASAGGYAALFPNLFEHGPLAEDLPFSSLTSFETQDAQGKVFSVLGNTIPWLDGKPATVLFLRNVDEQHHVEKKLYNLAYLDTLTGIPNRLKFKKDFDDATKEIEAGRLYGIVAILDMDNFKNVNDTYGHNTGDIMLKRLTEHLQADPVFKGHLYRLGGDEFVLFFTDSASRFNGSDAFCEHYSQLLQGALLNYTMPNIELSCTISMGVAFFPQYGLTTSELLRKADIALYKAKTAGRNQIVFFEDRYDTAKKFKDLYINIQPVLTHLGHTYGYELVDRGNDGNQEEDSLNLSEFDRTIDALGLGEMQSNARYFITFANQLLNTSVAHNLPKDKFVVQVYAPDNDGKKELAKMKQLHASGYLIALVGLRAIHAKSPLLALADYCKFEPGAVDGLTQSKFIGNNPAKKFIAAGVDNASAFEAAKRQGFKLFQGFFFSEPVVVQKTKNIDPLKVNYFRLLKLTSTDDYVDFNEISSVISSDVALSYKLLRLLNSAAVGLRNQISSIDMALAYLGEENLKKWIALLALRGIADDKPLELVRLSLIRAQFGELLAPHFKPRRDSKHVFLVGLFSLLHIALEKTREELFEELPVAEDIRQSLLTDHGPYSDLLAFFSSYEYSNWEEVTRFSEDNRISGQTISDSYLTAVKWYNQLVDTNDAGSRPRK